MNILVTNDDGIAAPGLRALCAALSEFADVVVIAPERNWSAAGHSKTLRRPLRVRESGEVPGIRAYVTDGSPSDCVALALLGFVPQRPDLVVSGINAGLNLADDVTYSGTVAAAMEAVLGGVPAIAVSAEEDETNHTPAAAFAALLARTVLTEGLPKGVLLNTNVPKGLVASPPRVEITCLGKSIFRDVLLERPDSDGGLCYWIGGERPAGLPEPGTDIGAVSSGSISITPIHLDLTCYQHIDSLREWQF